MGRRKEISVGRGYRTGPTSQKEKVRDTEIKEVT